MTGFSPFYQPTDAVIPSTLNGYTVTAVGDRAFSYNNNLKSIVFPDTVETFGEHVLWAVQNLESITLPKSLYSTGEWFLGYSNIQSIALPASLTELGRNSLIYLGELQSIEVESGNTAYTSVDGILFSADRTMLVRYPAGRQTVKYILPSGIKKLSEAAFHKAQFSAVILPEGLENIPDEAFADYENLEEIYIPASVTYISHVEPSEQALDAFCNDDALRNVWFGGTEDAWKTLQARLNDTVTVHYKTSASSILCENTFTDINSDQYWYKPVLWATENQITSGVGNHLFAPGKPCTRGEVVTFLWRIAGSPEPEKLSNFTDVPNNKYYAKAVAWASEMNITQGFGEDIFAPEQIVTREQFISFLYRFAGSPKVYNRTSFKDVGLWVYYTNAVSWAAENGIANGKSATVFGVGSPCTRGETVALLYRYAKTLQSRN